MNGDRLVELDEVFRVDLSDAMFDGQSDATRVLLTDSQGLGTILNDDMAIVSVDDVSAVEGDSGTNRLVFTISMDAAASLDTSLTIRSDDGLQAIVNADYFGIPNQDLIIPAGQTKATIAVDIIGDSIVEVDETFFIILSDALFGGNVDVTRISIGDDTGVATITNDDSALISIDNVRAIEGDDGVTDFVFTIRQDAIASLDTTVSVDTSDIFEAIAGTDYNAISNQVITIAAGTRTATISVGVIGETLVEATESFRVDLSSPQFGGSIDLSRIGIGIASGIGTILNDDVGEFLIEDLVVNEADGTVLLTVSIANPIDVDTTLRFSLDQNADIQNLDNQITFQAGASRSESIRLTIVDDVLVEGTETYIGIFELMTRFGDGDITATVAASIDILDNDRATFAFSDLSVDEAAGTVNLTVAVDAPFDVDATFDLVAPPQSDIVLIDGAIVFRAGSTEAQTVAIAINDDQLVELNEMIDIRLVAATDLGTRDFDVTDTGRIEIIENDTATFSVQDITVREGDGTISFRVSVDNAIDVDTALSIQLSSTEDLSIETPTIIFPGGSKQSQGFSIGVIDDDIEELTERVAAVIGVETELGSRVVAAPANSILTITDDDTPDYLQAIGEDILTRTIPIFVTTTAPGGNSNVGGDTSGSGGSAGPASTTTNQAPADSAADGSPDAAGGEDVTANETVASIGFVNQDSSATSSEGGMQSFSSSDGSAEFEDTGSNQSKNVSSESEFGSDAGELHFHVVLPNGELGERNELDIELLNEASLFDRFRGLPTDVYRVLYREPGSDTFQQLFEIYVVDGKIETILYSRNAPIEQVDPTDDLDGPATEAATKNDDDTETLPVPDGTEASLDPGVGGIGRLAGPMIAASLALSKSSEPWKNRVLESTSDRPIARMDKVSRSKANSESVALLPSPLVEWYRRRLTCKYA